MPTEETTVLPPEWADVEERVRAHPEYALLVADLLDKLAVARERRWTGSIQVDIQTGIVKSKLEIRAA